jgi:serine/threonine-protein kinase
LSDESLAGVRPGDVLAGKYRVEKVLGVGGMGVVVSAHHLVLDEMVALKFLLPETLRNPEAVSRFVREARAAVKIKSEHVARVSDVGQLENGSPYMVMEYLQGGDLAEWLRQRGPLPFEQAVDFVLQACVAVADAHALGIVHRDLKPANLFCVRRSDGQLTIKVLDFGISKMTNLGSSGKAMEMTKTSALMGSPLYMSPEQMRSSKEVDATTDIWAMGVILFELLTGKPAFLAETVTELAIAVANDPPPLLRTYRPDAPNGLDAVIGKCLEKDRRKRFRNVGDLSVALLPFASKNSKVFVERVSGIIQAAGLSESALAIPLSPKAGAANTGSGSAGTLPPMGRTTAGGSKKGMAIGGAILGAVVLIGGIVTAVALSKKPSATPADSPVQAASAGVVAPLPSPAPPTATPSVAVASALAQLPEPAPTPSAAQASPSGVAKGVPASGAQGPKVATGGTKSTNAAGAAPQASAAPAPTHAAAPTKTSCDPPYYFDAKGNRNFKPECM